MAFLHYWRKLDEIIPNHIISAHDKQRLASVIDSLNSNIQTLSTSTS